MRRFNFQDPDFDARFGAFADARRDTPETVDAAVRELLEAVRARGLEALLAYTRRFDGVELEAAGRKVGADEIAEGAEHCRFYTTPNPRNQSEQPMQPSV